MTVQSDITASRVERHEERKAGRDTDRDDDDGEKKQPQPSLSAISSVLHVYVCV